MIATLMPTRTKGRSKKKSRNIPKLTPELKPNTRLKNGVISMTRGGVMTTFRMSHFVQYIYCKGGDEHATYSNDTLSFAESFHDLQIPLQL
jgi:hypothetical protein